MRLLGIIVDIETCTGDPLTNTVRRVHGDQYFCSAAGAQPVGHAFLDIFRIVLDEDLGDQIFSIWVFAFWSGRMYSTRKYP